MTILAQEVIRLLTLYADEKEEMESLGPHVLARVMELGPDGAAIRSNTSGSKPLVNHALRDYRKIDHMLTFLGKANANRGKYVKAFALARCDLTESINVISAGYKGKPPSYSTIRSVINEGLAALELWLYLGVDIR